VKALALIDGEHYLPVNKAALEELSSKRGYEWVGAVFLGGMEKVGSPEDLRDLGLPLVLEGEMLERVARAVEQFRPDVAVDLSDEPVVGYRERFQIANLLLGHEVTYEGADFRFTPPEYHDVCEKPSLSVVGLAKRVGKTAIGAFAARVLKGGESGCEGRWNPCVVTMGRGGPPEPMVLHGEELEMTAEFLLERARAGEHAASDHFEDALMGRVTTIGCRRCGGGMSGLVFTSVVEEGALVANSLPNDFVIFEGSGATIPPIRTDACIVTVGADQPEEYINGYFGPYRVTRGDLIVLTMCEEPMASPKKVARVSQLVRWLKPEARVIETVFRPQPIGQVSDRKLFFITTAPEEIGVTLRGYLEAQYKCKVVAGSHRLSNRPALREDFALALAGEERPDTVLVELKAAAVDVVTELALKEKLGVVYCDNVPVTVGGDGDLAEEIVALAEQAARRYAERKG